jgi:heme oxygenase
MMRASSPESSAPSTPSRLLAVQPGPARLHVRQATHAAHVALDHHPLLAGITRPGYPCARLAAVLAAYHPLLAGFESEIERHCARVPAEDGVPAAPGMFDYAQRHKLPWLTADLAALRQDPLTSEQARVGMIAPLNGPADLAGLLYVLEGATLGGHVIAGALRKNLGLDATCGLAFYTAYGEETGPHWRVFCEYLERACACPETRSIAAQRALSVFAAFSRALDAAMLCIECTPALQGVPP